ncbi:MAG: HD domain-containing protein [Deinococcus sp.]
MFRRLPLIRLEALPPFPAGALLVGGAVRDLLRGVAPGDWDWAAPDPRAAAEETAARLGVPVLGGSVFALDEERGYYRVTGPAPAGTAGEQHDFVPLPPDLEGELRRRDFTVNALALHQDGRLIDPSGGLGDLRGRRLRMVSEANLGADPLRLLRAGRLSLTLGFRLERGTEEAVRRLAACGLPLPAPERVRGELEAVLLHPEAARGVLLLQELGLLKLSLPELLEGWGMAHGGFHHLDVFHHGVEALHQRLARFPDAPLELRWATLLHDVGKPRARSEDEGRVHFYGHDRLGASLARAMLTRLRCPGIQVERVSALVAAHMLPLPASEREARRFVHRRRALLPDLLALMLADREAARGPQSGEGSRQRYRQGMDRVLAALEGQPGPVPPLLGGEEVMGLLGLTPGPRVGAALRALAEARALGDLRTADEARAWLLEGAWERENSFPPADR